MTCFFGAKGKKEIFFLPFCLFCDKFYLHYLKKYVRIAKNITFSPCLIVLSIDKQKLKMYNNIYLFVGKISSRAFQGDCREKQKIAYVDNSRCRRCGGSRGFG